MGKNVFASKTSFKLLQMYVEHALLACLGMVIDVHMGSSAGLVTNGINNKGVVNQLMIINVLLILPGMALHANVIVNITKSMVNAKSVRKDKYTMEQSVLQRFNVSASIELMLKTNVFVSLILMNPKVPAFSAPTLEHGMANTVN